MLDSPTKPLHAERFAIYIYTHIYIHIYICIQVLDRPTKRLRAEKVALVKAAVQVFFIFTTQFTCFTSTTVQILTLSSI